MLCICAKSSIRSIRNISYCYSLCQIHTRELWPLESRLTDGQRLCSNEAPTHENTRAESCSTPPQWKHVVTTLHGTLTHHSLAISHYTVHKCVCVCHIIKQNKTKKFVNVGQNTFCILFTFSTQHFISNSFSFPFLLPTVTLYLLLSMTHISYLYTHTRAWTMLAVQTTCSDP